jgi:hypothetical protein
LTFLGIKCYAKSLIATCTSKRLNKPRTKKQENRLLIIKAKEMEKEKLQDKRKMLA